MSRVKRGIRTRARHHKILKAAKGYWGHKSKLFKVANQQVSSPATMLTVTEETRREISESSGSFVSMLHAVLTI